ncbi:MAG: hypothetical protein BWK73_04835 [Thiothrix lacustris]|uniref:Uncharacterized protein n=1 Tax=Thiothrix lacustris TaxID=525917 RepID=A0A1Y1QY73_9GAMM|nr:MAG: hypothetical protein BWK73_04835 [Thiothrix lacustris]
MPRIQFNMRIEQDIKQGLDDAAKSQNRTTANLIEWLLKQYIEQVAKRGTSRAPAEVELDFATPDELHTAITHRRPAIADTLKYLEDKS